VTAELNSADRSRGGRGPPLWLRGTCWVGTDVFHERCVATPGLLLGVHALALHALLLRELWARIVNPPFSNDQWKRRDALAHLRSNRAHGFDIGPRRPFALAPIRRLVVWVGG
jgi:hypothetical protein